MLLAETQKNRTGQQTDRRQKMQIGNKIFDTEHHTAVMAILNVTPDSFRMAAATKYG